MEQAEIALYIRFTFGIIARLAALGTFVYCIVKEGWK